MVDCRTVNGRPWNSQRAPGKLLVTHQHVRRHPPKRKELLPYISRALFCLFTKPLRSKLWSNKQLILTFPSYCFFLHIANLYKLVTEQETNLLQENGRDRKKFKPKDNRKKSKIDLDRAQGYCIKYTNSKDCRYGSDCKYIHSNEVPKSVADYAKSLL